MVHRFTWHIVWNVCEVKKWNTFLPSRSARTIDINSHLASVDVQKLSIFFIGWHFRQYPSIAWSCSQQAFIDWLYVKVPSNFPVCALKWAYNWMRAHFPATIAFRHWPRYARRNKKKALHDSNKKSKSDKLSLLKWQIDNSLHVPNLIILPFCSISSDQLIWNDMRKWLNKAHCWA